MSRRRALVALLLCAALAGLGAAPAIADVEGPDDTVAQAFGPIAPGVWYSGTFVRADDVDHLAIRVQEPNLALHVDVENTVSPCLSVWLNGCPIWGTLVDAQGQQVGGEGSSAGTGQVDAGWKDVIDWTFPASGTYFLAMDSAGDLPSYRVRATASVPPPLGETGAGGAGGPSAGTGAPPASELPGAGEGGPTLLPSTPAASLAVPRRQRGTVVRGRLSVRLPLRRLTLAVHRPGDVALASLRMLNVRAGRQAVALRLGAAGRRALARAGRLRLTVRLVAVPVTGSRLIVRRAVVLHRPAAR